MSTNDRSYEFASRKENNEVTTYPLKTTED